MQRQLVVGCIATQIAGVANDEHIPFASLSLELLSDAVEFRFGGGREACTVEGEERLGGHVCLGLDPLLDGLLRNGRGRHCWLCRRCRRRNFGHAEKALRLAVVATQCEAVHHHGTGFIAGGVQVATFEHTVYLQRDAVGRANKHLFSHQRHRVLPCILAAPFVVVTRRESDLAIVESAASPNAHAIVVGLFVEPCALRAGDGVDVGASVHHARFVEHGGGGRGACQPASRDGAAHIQVAKPVAFLPSVSQGDLAVSRLVLIVRQEVLVNGRPVELVVAELETTGRLREPPLTQPCAVSALVEHARQFALELAAFGIANRKPRGVA